MTPEKRAAIFIDWVYGDTPSDSGEDHKMLTDMFKASEQEAYTKGFADAIEKAAKICRTHLDFEWAANKIEALKPEGK